MTVTEYIALAVTVLLAELLVGFVVGVKRKYLAIQFVNGYLGVALMTILSVFPQFPLSVTRSLLVGAGGVLFAFFPFL